MRPSHQPPDEPVPWTAILPVQEPGTPRPAPWPDAAGPAGRQRTAGLHHVARLTWRASQLGALAAVGFATVFARTAPAQTVSSQGAPAPGTRPATAAPSPSRAHRPHAAHHPRARHRHRHHAAALPPAPPPPTPAAAAGAAAAPTPTLAPPTTAPAPAPTSAAPAPTPTISTHSVHGG
jgi:hypothetical protein